MKVFGKDKQGSIYVGGSLAKGVLCSGQETFETFIAQTSARRNLLLQLWQMMSHWYLKSPNQLDGSCLTRLTKQGEKRDKKATFLKTGGHTSSPLSSRLCQMSLGAVQSF